MNQQELKPVLKNSVAVSMPNQSGQTPCDERIAELGAKVVAVGQGVNV